MISRLLRVPRAHQVRRSIESLMNLTEPSQKATLTPPGWLLVAVIAAPIPPQVGFEMNPDGSGVPVQEMPAS